MELEASSFLALPHARAAMDDLSVWLDRRFDTLGITGALAHAVRLCLEEAVLNVIVHSSPAPGVPPDIVVRLDRRMTGLVATVEDHGPLFDPTAFNPPAQSPAGVEAAHLGGFGITLMRRYAAGMSYRRSAGRNHLRFDFATPDRPSSKIRCATSV